MPGAEPGLADELRAPPSVDALCARHLRIGWIALLFFATFGIGLELLHAFKLGFYLDVGRETRRLMWTLAHAHGVGLGLLNLGFGLSLRALFQHSSHALAWISTLTFAATLLLPLGFFLGGIVVYDGDPGFPVLLVPLGALALWLALALMAREVWRATRTGCGG